MPNTAFQIDIASALLAGPSVLQEPDSLDAGRYLLSASTTSPSRTMRAFGEVCATSRLKVMHGLVGVHLWTAMMWHMCCPAVLFGVVQSRYNETTSESMLAEQGFPPAEGAGMHAEARTQTNTQTR
jgi:hypothetical protein